MITKEKARRAATLWALAGFVLCLFSALPVAALYVVQSIERLCSLPYRYAIVRMLYWVAQCNEAVKAEGRFFPGDAIMHRVQSTGAPQTSEDQFGIVNSITPTGIVFVQFEGSSLPRGCHPGDLTLIRRKLG